MRGMKLKTAAAVASVALLAACSSAASSSGGGTTNSVSSPSGPAAVAGSFPNGTLTVGLMTDLTGLAAETYTTTVEGLQIAFNAINKAGGVNGQKLAFVTADTGSTPAGALAAAQKLVEQNHVPIILAITSVSFGAAPWATEKGIPMIGPSNSSPGWGDPKNTNLFDVLGNPDPAAVTPGFGEFAKQEGATVCGGIGDANIPTDNISEEAAVQSCVQAGLKAGPINDTVPYGGTNVAPAALQLKNGGVDALASGQANTTSTSLIEQLSQLGVQLKASELPIGYGSELLADKPAVAALQGQGFSVEMTPVEANTPGAKAFKAALAAGGVTGPPGYGEQESWIVAWALVAGLDKFGKPNPTPAQFIPAMRSVNNFDADGALAPEKINFDHYNNKYSCLWMVKLQGDAFVPVPNSPFCGTATRDVSS